MGESSRRPTVNGWTLPVWVEKHLHRKEHTKVCKKPRPCFNFTDAACNMLKISTVGDHFFPLLRWLDSVPSLGWSLLWLRTIHQSSDRFSVYGWWWRLMLPAKLHKQCCLAVKHLQEIKKPLKTWITCMLFAFSHKAPTHCVTVLKYTSVVKHHKWEQSAGPRGPRLFLYWQKRC